MTEERSPAWGNYPWILIGGWTLAAALAALAFLVIFNFTFGEVTSSHALRILEQDLAHVCSRADAQELLDQARHASPELQGFTRLVDKESADLWQQRAIDSGRDRVTEVVNIEGAPHVRALVRLEEQRCSSGQVAASLALPLAPYLSKKTRNIGTMAIAVAGLWLLGLVGIVLGFRRFQRGVAERRAIEARMQSVQKLESLGVLAGGIAHDFNNLLAAVVGHADLAKTSTPEDAPAYEHMEKVLLAAQRSADLVHQMLAYAGRGHAEVSAVDLSALVRETTDLMTASVSKVAVLHCDLADTLPNVEGDATQLRQVLMNLISNASDSLAGAAGEIRIATSERQIDAEHWVVLEVSDTGAGMSAATRERIFEPFFTTKESGRGLGLAAVLGIIKSHRGAVNISSRVGKGTTFEVMLPASEAAAAARTDTSPQSSKPTGTVLVVDDERLVRDMARAVLELHGWVVAVAVDGVTAIEMLSQRNDVVAVLLDLSMPHMSGEAALEKIRQLRPNLPVILSSGFDKDEVGQRFVGRAHLAFLHKPYLPDALLDTLARVMTR